MIVVVLGDSRSGTSMIAIMLHMLGINMNPDTTKTVNPFGCYEDVEFTNLTVEVKKKLDNEKKYDLPEIRFLMKPIVRDLYKKRSKENKHWGFKSALTHYMPGIFLCEEYDLRLIYSVRNIFHQTKSELYRLHETRVNDINMLLPTMRKYHKGLGQLMSVMENYSRKFPSKVICKEDINKNPVKVINGIKNFLNIDADYDKKELKEKIITDYVSWERK